MRAEVIAVPVRGDQVIDLREAGVLDRRHDALGVSRRRRAAIAGIDEHRLARRRHEQRGVAALDVDDVDVERLASASAPRRRNQNGERQERNQ